MMIIDILSCFDYNDEIDFYNYVIMSEIDFYVCYYAIFRLTFIYVALCYILIVISWHEKRRHMVEQY